MHQQIIQAPLGQITRQSLEFYHFQIARQCLANWYCIPHILAQAIQRSLDPAVKLGTGPAIENGFYYDISLTQGLEFNETSLKETNKIMQ